MATVWKVLTVLAALALSASAYLDPNYKYLFWTEMNVNNLQPGTTNTADVGVLFAVFTPSNNVLQYWIYDTLAPPVNVNQVALFGPDSCLALYPGSYPDEYVGGGSCSYSAPQQIVLTTLGSGPTISTVTLNTGQIEMLFDNQMFVRLDSSVYPAGHMAGHLSYQSYAPVTSSFAELTQQYTSFVFMGGNSGQFPDETTSSTSNTGFIFLFLSSSNPPTIYYQIFHTVGRGSLSLNCPNVVPSSISFSQGAVTGMTGYISLEVTGGKDYTPMITEVFTDAQCYFVLTSGAYPNGELFGWVVRYGQYVVSASGAIAGANGGFSGSADYASCSADFDLGSRIIGFQCVSNFTTDSVTSYQIISGSTGLVICNGTGVVNTGPDVPTAAPSQPSYLTIPSQFFCQVNASNINDVYNQQIWLVVTTVKYPNGAIKGQLLYNNDEIGVAGSSGLSVGAQAAIGVVVGVVGLAAIAGVAFLGYKKGWHEKLTRKV